jgi:hypothetical protein
MKISCYESGEVFAAKHEHEYAHEDVHLMHC